MAVAQPGVGLVARVRRTPHQEDRDAGQHDHETRSDAGDRGRQRLAAIGIGRALGKQTVFLGPHPHREIFDMFHGVAPDALADDLGGVVHALRPRQLDGGAEFVDPLVIQRHDLADEPPLNRIVADELAQPRQRRRQFGEGLLKIGSKVRPQCREVAALCAFGAPQLQLDERYLVFDLKGAQNPARVLARQVHQMDRTGADGGQYQESRRKQQDVAHGALAPGISGHGDLVSWTNRTSALATPLHPNVRWNPSVP
jgi:hypothetical protein